ncbi:TPA: hypothetical protein ACH3X1_007151 [Trebouxia sp. C0004]
MALKSFYWCVAIVLLHFAAASQDPAWVLPGDSVPSNSIRLVALGTGTPSVYKEQVSTSYLLQTGDGQNFIFDVGTGSIVNLYATNVNLATINKVFLSHLHSDHITDLAPLYAIANGRTSPLQVWGPSGATAATGTNATVAGLRAFLGWDQVSRNHVSQFPANYTGNQLVANEFLYNATNQIIYNQSGVQDTLSAELMRQFVMISAGDTVPLTTFVNFAQGSDVVIHESVGPVWNFSTAGVAGQNILLNHTSQTQVGQVFAALNPAPRLAIATHLSVNEYSIVPIISAIRSTYPVGPLAIAQDLNVWDISPTNITQRRFLVQPNIQGGIFVPVGGSTDPAGYSLPTVSAQTWPFPTVTDSGLTLLSTAVNTTSTSQTSTAG